MLEADASRQPYTPTLAGFVVSPANARKVLTTFISKATKQLLIYDPMISDPQILRLLNARSKAGVEIKVIGRVSPPNPGLEIRNLNGLRLHTRTIIRDRRQAFVGSQSLLRAELDSRREVGVIVHEPVAVSGLIKTFESDWERPEVEEKELTAAKPRVSNHQVKALVKELSPLNPIVNEAVRQVASETEIASLDLNVIKETVKEAVQYEVRDRVREMVRESLEES